jgi:DNA-binding NarL/FixJ family response regulator
MNQDVVRVLIVDDFRQWQSFVIQHLAQHTNVSVVGLAADGLEAVFQAGELQPDLILLDVSLPKLDGIEAARKIRRSVPNTKILFLSSSSDADVVRDAFCAGGQGYVLKSEAGASLLTAMEAVLLGKRFVSPSLVDIDIASDSPQ